MKSFLSKMVSTGGDVSFGRVFAGLWALFYMAQHAWFWHLTGHMVENTTVLTHLGVITTLYGLGKIPSGGQQPS